MGKSEIIKHELIGNKIEIIDSKNKCLIGIKGSVIDETKYTLVIKQKEKIKRIIKKGTIIKINDMMIEGEKLVSRPEERIKK